MSTLKPFLVGCLCGIKDSFLGLVLLTNIDNDEQQDRPPSRRSSRLNPKKKKTKVLPLMTQSCFLNAGVLLLSVLLFESYVIPIVKFVLVFFSGLFVNGRGPQSSLWSWVEPLMLYTFKYLWVIPLFWLCKILNCIWFVEIADAAFRKKYGAPKSSLLASKESVFKVISKSMADFVFSIMVETLFLIQAQLVSSVPIFGTTLLYVHMSLLYSLYAFEYTWSNLGWSVVRRIGFIESNWLYFTGFGLLLSTLTYISPSAIISACIFGTVFPVFILSGLEARPYEECQFSLHLFSFVIWLTNKLFLFKTPVRTTPSSTNR